MLYIAIWTHCAHNQRSRAPLQSPRVIMHMSAFDMHLLGRARVRNQQTYKQRSAPWRWSRSAFARSTHRANVCQYIRSISIVNIHHTHLLRNYNANVRARAAQIVCTKSRDAPIFSASEMMILARSFVAWWWWWRLFIDGARAMRVRFVKL